VDDACTPLLDNNKHDDAVAKSRGVYEMKNLDSRQEFPIVAEEPQENILNLIKEGSWTRDPASPVPQNDSFSGIVDFYPAGPQNAGQEPLDLIPVREGA